MQNVLTKIVQEVEANSENIYGVRIGIIVSLEQNGRVFLDYTDNPFGPLRARAIVQVCQGDVGSEVLIIFENNDPRVPIILGYLQEEQRSEIFSKEIPTNLDKIKDVTFDGERIVFSAKKEIVLHCGKGSITVRKDGKIVVKGTNIISRSAGQNKIKGASVGIN